MSTLLNVDVTRISLFMIFRFGIGLIGSVAGIVITGVTAYGRLKN